MDTFDQKKQEQIIQKCSVAIASYNGEKYIKKQLESICFQTRPVDEVIVTDDCSNDNTVEIVKNFIKDNQLKNWRIIENTTNLGYSKNFEKCVSLCSGDVIFLCDQDDIWAPEKVREMLSVFERYEDCLSIVTNFKLINSNGEPLFDSQNDNCWCYSKKMKKIHDCLYKIDLIEVLNHNVAPGCTLAIKKRIVDIFLNCKYKTIHDYRISLIAALNGGLYYLDKPLIEYRIHENNNIGYPSYCLMRKNREKK